jgi:DNA-binding NarL/FixJ family response regulator
MSRLRFVVADDHRMFAEALRMLLQPLGDVAAFAETRAELQQMVWEHRPDFVITDVTLPDGTGIEAIRALRRGGLRMPMLVITVHADELLQREAFDAGANGYVLKSAAFGELVAAISAVQRGEQYMPERGTNAAGSRSPLERLSEREHEVLRLMAAGRTGLEIAATLGITPRTVAFHKERMRERLGVATSTDAVNLYRSVQRV